MIKPRYLFIFLFFIVSCASEKGLKINDSADLIGTWELKFDGVYPYWFSQIGFTGDGRKCVLNYEFDANGFATIDYFLSNYRVENGYLYSEVVFSSTPYVRASDVIKDRVDTFKQDYFEVIMVSPVSGSTLEKHQRLNGVSPEALCKVVENFRITSQSKKL